ncbi:SMI1/KNR4 family protein [Trichlorobacter lovleyi]|uniref:SMI1/KNR4 family protein n=1 Tax=Trichlorobacter lovleyi TaxID=313985 RepID=UPI00223FD4A4|nr:SMI1/KNR4 family protein [Trichlorobacter lovleyi]QOX77410.1 SMI1/KNR4 family protein [Trichlorobacter lovleyi]
MSAQSYSEKIKQQTDLVIKYLEIAKPLITYTKLVSVSEEQITQYEQQLNKIVPPDYRYWLTTYGSGRIEFLEGSLLIDSIFELMESDGRCVDEGDPQDCWKRIYIGYPGAPITMALDSTIIDEYGCAPVIETDEYGNTVGQVLASSWPMYVIRNIIETSKPLKASSQCNVFTADQVTAVNELANQEFLKLDESLGRASERAEAHNQTCCSHVSFENDNLEMSHGMANFFEELLEKMDKQACEQQLSDACTTSGKEDSFPEAIARLEDQIAKGYASLIDNLFLYRETAHCHANLIQSLRGHERKELRKIAEECWLWINPGEAEKQAEILCEWLECAKS